MKFFSRLFLILVGSLWLSQCSSPQIKTRQIQNGALIEAGKLNAKIQFYSDTAVRILKWPTDGTAAKTSLSVIATPATNLETTMLESRETIILKSTKLIVLISKRDLRIDFLTPDSQAVLKEKGLPEFNPVVYSGDSAFSVKQQFQLTADEGVYGLGQHQDGVMNYRGKTVKLVQSNTEAVSPLLVSTRGYGILWDNYSKTIFTDESQGASFWSDVGDNIDYYFILGGNIDGAIAGYRQLTGAAPLFGKWAYGYWQSKEHYHTRAELMKVAVEYRRQQMPIDNIIQDWDYWNGAQNWGGMFFDAKLFPQPEQMVNELHRMNYHLMISIWPALGPNTAIYKDMAQHGFLYAPIGWAGFKYYDAFNPAANALYWQYLKNGLYTKGIDGWWIDSTEPDVINALTKESCEYELKKMGRNSLGSWARYLNAFSLAMTDALYQNLRRETEQKRVFILTRSTYAGQQRNAAVTWSGDIGANWDIYKKQIAAGLNHSLAGIPYRTFDIGAFVIGAYGGVFNQGGKDPAYQELYTRMFQLGTFSPIFRSHGSETPREIWEMGEFIAPILKFDNLRYRLLPYIYSLAWCVTHDGYTLMRGLPMDFAADKNTYAIADQFMFGPALMVCPVTEYQLHRPPEPSVLIGRECFKTRDGKPGLVAQYYKDLNYQTLGREQIEPNIDVFWYTGRPEYVTDSTFAIRWQGKLIPQETGKHQFHLKSFDAKRIKLDGRILPIVYTSVEQYTAPIDLVAGKEYELVVETENRSTGAARMQLFWKTPAIFAREQTVEKRESIRPVYLPAGTTWIDFWSGEEFAGGQTISADAPIDKIPLLLPSGAILPLGPLVQFAIEKPADPIELRIYPGADGSFTLYEDENDTYNYEQGVYAAIDFHWRDSPKTLIIDDRQGSFPGMLVNRSFHVILVTKNHGTGIETTPVPDRIVHYRGQRQTIEF